MVLPVARRHDGLRWFGVVVLWAEAPGRSSPARSGGPAARPSFCSPFWFGRLVLIYVLLSPCLVQSFVSFMPSWLVYLSQSTTGAGFGDTPGHPGSASLDAGFRSRFAGCGWDCSHSFLCLLGRICCFEENIAIFTEQFSTRNLEIYKFLSRLELVGCGL